MASYKDFKRLRVAPGDPGHELFVRECVVFGDRQYVGSR